MLVKLTVPEIARAGAVGSSRVAYNSILERQNRYGEQGWGLENHVLGAIAEYATAKAFDDGIWTPSTKVLDYAGDVGNGRQVRSTQHPGGGLLIHDADPDDHKFLLAIVALPKIRLVGWLYGEEAKRPEYWREPQPGRPAYLVPQHRLKRFVAGGKCLLPV